jgi:hypothetical protein
MYDDDLTPDRVEYERDIDDRPIEVDPEARGLTGQ